MSEHNTDIKPLHMWSQAILPLTYSQSLSYMEQLSKMAYKMNEVIEALNNYYTNVLTAANAYTDEKVRDSIAVFEAAVADLTNQFNAFTKDVGGTLSGFQQQMDENFAKQNDEIAGGRAYTDQSIADNNEWILEQISESLISVRVLNPFTGERVSIQDMIDYLSALHMTNTATISEIANAQKTVNVVIGYNATCTQMVNNSKSIFGLN